MMRWVMITMAIVSFGMTGCASKRPPKPFQLLAAEFVAPVNITRPIDAKSAVIGITIRSDKWPPGTENRLYLVKVDSDGNPYRGSTLIPTSVVKSVPGASGGGTVYVQNIPPGRYAAVAYSESARGYGRNRELTVFLFSRELVKQTDTSVSAGTIAFMGEYDLGPDTMILKPHAADDAQQHYFEVLWGKSLPQVVEDLNLIGTPAYFGFHTLGAVRGSRDASAEEQFLNTARHQLDPAWTAMIEQRLPALK
jgi:hypothetical protein